jgi:hypothetical protein
MSRAPAQSGALCHVRDQVVRMRKILTESATGGAQPPATRRQSPAELVCLALVLALVTLAGRIVTIW